MLVDNENENENQYSYSFSEKFIACRPSFTTDLIFEIKKLGDFSNVRVCLYKLGDFSEAPSLKKKLGQVSVQRQAMKYYINPKILSNNTDLLLF